MAEINTNVNSTGTNAVKVVRKKKKSVEICANCGEIVSDDATVPAITTATTTATDKLSESSNPPVSLEPSELSEESNTAFHCSKCDCNVCVSVPIYMFAQMVKAGVFKKNR